MTVIKSGGNWSDDAARLQPGSRLGRYEIRTSLGAGGMGEVYAAWDPRLGREVAIKVLPAAFCADAERLARFEQEASAAGSLNHPNVLAVHDVGTDNGVAGNMMMVAVQADHTFRAGKPTPLFHVELGRSVFAQYDVSADGQRFIVNATAGTDPLSVGVAVNWMAALRKP